VILDRPFPTFPHGFPPEVIDRFERLIGRGSLGNVAASGTEILESLGEESRTSGKPIVYTSADSVFQVAAHVENGARCPAPRLVRLGPGDADRRRRGGAGHRAPLRRLGRSVRPDEGPQGLRRPSAGPDVLDAARAAGLPTPRSARSATCLGAGDRAQPPGKGNEACLAALVSVVREEPDPRGSLVFANLVDFDTLYGHRNDPAGYAKALRDFDAALGGLLEALRPGDVLMVTADHGNDPTTPSTDHSRELVPSSSSGTGSPRASTSAGGRPSPTSPRPSPPCSPSTRPGGDNLPVTASEALAFPASAFSALALPVPAS